MAEKPYRWTVDVEYDFGGRTNGTEGIERGLPRIIKNFADGHINAIFFISTEIQTDISGLVKELRDQGHEIGSHGHFHQKFKEGFRRQADKDLSLFLLGPQAVKFRAPKFNWETEDIYSQKKNHVSLLKHLWLVQKIKPETIIYLHPFDIVKTDEPPPNLFCRLWYSRPDAAFNLFKEMVNKYK